MSDEFEPDVDEMFFTLGSPWPVAVVLRNGGGEGEGTCERRTYAPRRTCRNLGTFGGFRCSECGFYERQLTEMECEPQDWEFCPNCGAKAVRG